MARVVRRDGEAFEAIFERHAEAVRLHLTNMLRDETATQDVVQEVFLRVWTRGEQWTGHGALRGWLLRIATNLALNHLRSAKRRKARPLVADDIDADESAEVPAWMIDASTLGPDMQAELAERRELVRELVDQLPDEKREVLRLLHDAHMEISQVAQALGIPEGTVKSRLHYATKQLAQEWHNIEPHEEE